MIDNVLAILSQLHFLRPLWLLGIFPIIFFITYLQLKQKTSGHWNNVISDHLLPHLLAKGKDNPSRYPLALLAMLWLICIIALAGPAWKQLPQPVFEKQHARVTILDLSYSMYATDIKPSRISRARLKLIDFLNDNKEGLNSLIVYSGDAHVVTPLTNDVNTIISLIPVLEPSIMPSLGSDVISAVQKAKSLLETSRSETGSILLFSDGIEANEMKQINKLLNNSGYSLSVLGVGTAEGGPIRLPNGQFFKDSSGTIIVPKLDKATLRELSQENGGAYLSLQNDNADLSKLSNSPALGDNEDTKESQLNFDVWQEEGQWLLFPILFLAAFSFRRGWILGLMIFIPLISANDIAYAENTPDLTAPVSKTSQIKKQWANLWQTDDQLGMKAFEKNDFTNAAEYFDSPNWKASAQYRAGDFSGASETFTLPKNAEPQTKAEHWYNRGNALAKSGSLNEAIEAYDKSLSFVPEYEDALFNKALVEKIEQQQSEQQDGEQQDGEQQDGEQGSEQEGQQGQDQQGQQGQEQEGQEGQQSQEQQDQQGQPSESEQQASQQESQEGENKEDGEEGEDSDENAAKKAEQDENGEPGEQFSESDLSPLQQEQKQALDQWLRRVPDDPGGLLKRKFELEAQKNRREGRSPYRKDQTW